MNAACVDDVLINDHLLQRESRPARLDLEIEALHGFSKWEPRRLQFGRVNPVPEVLKRQRSGLSDAEHGFGEVRPVQFPCLEIQVPDTDVGGFRGQPESFERFFGGLYLYILHVMP